MTRPYTWEIYLIYENFNLANNFWTLSARALILFLVIRPFRDYKHFFTQLPWPWGFTFFKIKFNLPKSFWTVTAKALIFHWNILWDKTLPCGTLYQQIRPCDLYLGFVLPSENFYLAKNFWTVCVKVFLVTRPFRGNHHFLLCDLDLLIWPTFGQLKILISDYEC